MADIDYDKVQLLLNIAKTIDESFPHLSAISAGCKEELGEMAKEIKAERLKNTPRSARPGMPTTMQESDPLPDDEEVEDRRTKPKAIPHTARRV